MSNLFQDADIRVGVTSGETNFTSIIIEDDLIGSSAANLVDPGATEYNNKFSPSNFYSVDPEEKVP